MIHLARNRVTFIWVVLVSATALSFAMGHGFGFDDVRKASVAIIIVAFVKVRFVILDFMEIRHAPIPMRIVGEVWAVVVCTALVVLYLYGGTAAPNAAAML